MGFFDFWKGRKSRALCQEPPEKLGFGRLVPESVRLWSDGFHAEYARNGKRVHVLSGQGDRWTLEDWFQGKELGSTDHRGPSEAVCQHFVGILQLFKGSPDPRIQELASEVARKGYNVKFTPPMPDRRFLVAYYPAGVLWELLIPRGPDNGKRWDEYVKVRSRAGRVLRPGSLAGVGPGALILVDLQGRQHVEKISLARLVADSVDLPDLVREARAMDAISRQPEYRAEGLCTLDTLQGNILGFRTDHDSNVLLQSLVFTPLEAGDRLPLPQRVDQVERWILEDRPGLARTLISRSASFLRRGDDLRALELGRRAVVLAPHSAEAGHWHAVCLVQVGRESEGLAEARRACQLAPDESRYRELVQVLEEPRGERPP